MKIIIFTCIVGLFCFSYNAEAVKARFSGAAKELFDSKCASCHQDGEKIQNLRGGHSIVGKIKRHNPSFDAELDDRQMMDLANYIEYTFERKVVKKPEPSKAEIEASLKKFQKEADLGTNVRAYVDNSQAQGSIMEVKGDKVKVQFTMRVSGGKWQKILPYSIWVSRHDLHFPETNSWVLSN